MNSSTAVNPAHAVQLTWCHAPTHLYGHRGRRTCVGAHVRPVFSGHSANDQHRGASVVLTPLYPGRQDEPRPAPQWFEVPAGELYTLAAQLRLQAYALVQHREALVQEVDSRNTALGPAVYIRIRRHDGHPMAWREVWDVFQEAYPDRWAVQVFPPRDCLMDEANYYHLFVLDHEPRGFNLLRS